MRIHATKGWLTWTPDHTQVGNYVVTLRQRDRRGIVLSTRLINFTVTLVGTAPEGIYVVPGGWNAGNGTLANPYRDLQSASKNFKPGDTIYLRGGHYRNADWGKAFAGRTKGNFALVNGLNGTQDKPIIIRSWGNEYVTINSDVMALSFKSSQWFTLEDVELKGTSLNITKEKATSLWWLTDERTAETGGSAISLNTCFHVTISRCIITDWPSSGITQNYGEYITVRHCVFSNSANWGLGGVHHFNNSKPGTGKKENEGDIKFLVESNLFVSAQQCIPSRVTSKGFAELKLDEGGGAHSQAQPTVAPEGGVVFGHWQVVNNLILFCGKSGANANLTGNLLIQGNSFFKNAQNTSSSDIHIQPAKVGDATYGMAAPSVQKNLIHSLPTARSINKLGDPTQKWVGIGENYIAAGGAPENADLVANTSVKEVPQVFQDPANLNFKRHSSVPAGFGADDATIDWLMSRAERFDIKLEPSPIITDEAYLASMKQAIFDSWPAPEVIDPEFGPNFELHDPVSGYEYVYATKHLYPGNPHPA
jgi:hypothetical protein